MNTNQLFKWRRQLLGSPPAPTELLPVEVVREATPTMPGIVRADAPPPGRIGVVVLV